MSHSRQNPATPSNLDCDGIIVFMESTCIKHSRWDPLMTRLIQQNREQAIKKYEPDLTIAKQCPQPISRTKCSCVCGMNFCKIAILTEHIKVCKTAITARVCRICSTLLPNRRALAAHKIIAHGTEPCIDCGRKFTNIRLLTKHRETKHTSHECRICGKKIKMNKYRLRHMRCHTKPFNCSKCKLRFSSGSGLKDHISSEHNGMTWKCKDCRMCYTHRSNLRAHVLEKHKSMRYFCVYCRSKGYTRKDWLQKHMLKVHGGVVCWEYRESIA